ncbi:MAG: SRPBCC domain-containing protein [Candidatus Promineifilaceae bacterium]
MNQSMVSQDGVVVERVFDAPAAFIWRAWTNPEDFKQWYGPTGLTVPKAELDVWVNGRRLVCMASPDGSKQMWTVGTHKELVPNTRLAYTESPSDEQGNAVSPEAMGMPPGFPAETMVTVTLAEENGRTYLTLTHTGVPEGAAGGWNMAFDKLADYIKATQP